MRLREINEIFKQNMPNLKINVNEGATLNSTQVYQFEKYKDNLNALLEIEKTGMIDEEIDSLRRLNANLYFTTDGNITVKGSELSEFIEISKKVYFKGQAINKIAESMYTASSENPYNLFVKIPVGSGELTLTDFSEIITKLEKSIEPLSKFDEFKDPETIKIDGFEKGSDWLILLFKTVVALELFGRLITIATKIGMQVLNAKTFIKSAQLVSAKQDYDQNFFDKISQANLGIIDKYIIDEINSDGEGKNNLEAEQISAASKVVLILNDLMNAGVSFDYATTASEEIRKNFPDISAQDALNSLQTLKDLKRLENNQGE